MRPLLLLCLGLLSLSMSGQEVLRFDLFFASDHHVLTDAHHSELEASIATLVNIPAAYEVHIEGHTDTDGNLEYNQALSERRAKGVKTWFTNRNFRIGEGQTTGYAFNRPRGDNSVESGKAKNRRVTVSIYIPEQKPAEVLGFGLEPKAYRFYAEEGRTITTEGGIKVRIEPGTFVDENGETVTGEIEVSIKEFNNAVDFLLGGVTMDFQGDGELGHFSSAGMLDLQANQDGEALQIGSDQEIELEFDYDDELEGVGYYRFDEASGAWEDLGNANTVTGHDLRADNSCQIGCMLSENQAYVEMVENGQKLASEKQALTPVYQHFLKYDAIHERMIDSVEKYEARLAAAEKQLFAIRKSYYIKKTIETRKEIIVKVQATPNSSSELSHYRNTTFRFDKQENAGFKGNLLGERWVDMELTYHPDRDQYSLLLLDDRGGEQTVSLRPNYGSKNTVLPEYIRSRSVNTFKKYQQERGDYGSCVRVDLAWKLEQESQKNLYIAKREEAAQEISDPLIGQINCLWNYSQEFITNDEEKGLCVQEWVSYFDQHHTEMEAHYTGLSDHPRVVRAREMLEAQNLAGVTMASNEDMAAMMSSIDKTLSIKVTGTYNADQVKQIQAPMMVKAKYKDAAGEEIFPTRIYLVDSKIKGLIEYNGMYNTSPYRFPFGTRSDNMLFAMDAEGNLFTCRKEFFKSVQKNGEETPVTIPLEPLKTDDRSDLDEAVASR